MSTTFKLSDREFEDRFGNYAILIKKGGYEFSEQEKITAFRCVDDITVFGVEREKQKVKSIMAWRFCDGKKNESVVDIQLKFHELVTPQANCSFYIVGGTIMTTMGQGCLLDRIRQAIYGYFTQPKIDVVIRENQSMKHQCMYVTVKLEMNGQIMDCYHN